MKSDSPPSGPVSFGFESDEGSQVCPKGLKLPDFIAHPCGPLLTV